MEAQQKFTFERNEQFRLLDAASMPNAVHALLRAIVVTVDECPSVQHLSKMSRLKRLTLLRAIQRAEAMQLLKVERRAIHGRNTTSQYAIMWDAVRALPNRHAEEAAKNRARREKNCERRKAKPPQRAGRSQNDTSQSHFETTRYQNETCCRYQNETTLTIPLKEIKSSPPSKSVGDSGDCVAEEEVFDSAIQNAKCKASEDEPMRQETTRQPGLFDPPPESPDVAAAWRTAARKLAACGVGRANEAIGLAKDAGWTLKGVHAAIEHWLTHRGAWKPGALYARFQFTHPDTPIAEGWPDPDPAYLAEQRREAEIEAARLKATANTAGETQRQREQRQRAEFEARYGPRLDALDASTVHAEAEQCGEGALFLLKGRGGRRDAMLRWMIFQRWHNDEAKHMEGERCETREPSATT